MRPVITAGRIRRTVVAAVTGLGLLGASVGVTAPAGAASTNVLQVWAPKYMSRQDPATPAQAVAEAKKFNFMIAYTTDYPGEGPAMHKANRNLKLLAYLNATFAKSTDGALYPASWYVHDKQGRQVRSLSFGNYMMDPTNPSWIADRVKLCRQLLAESSFDGCGLDLLGTAPVNVGFTTSVGINPHTRKPWTGREWLTATGALAAKVRAAIKPKMVAGNGIGNGARYFSSSEPSSLILNAVDVGMAEVFLRDGRSSLRSYPTTAQWKANVNMIVSAESKGKSLVVVTKVWNSGTTAQKDAWHRFALASFLLGANGRSRFSFTYDINSNPATFHPWWSTQLGAPTSKYTAKSDGTYTRSFASGLALVNPGTATRTARLSTAMVTLSGKRVTSVTLPAHSGEVLHK